MIIYIYIISQNNLELHFLLEYMLFGFFTQNALFLRISIYFVYFWTPVDPIDVIQFLQNFTYIVFLAF